MFSIAHCLSAVGEVVDVEVEADETSAKIAVAIFNESDGSSKVVTQKPKFFVC